MSSAAFLSGAYEKTDGDGVVTEELEKREEDDAEEEEEDVEEGAEDVAANLSEKLYQISAFLKNLEGHPFVPFSEIHEKVGVDLQLNEDILERLKANDRLVVDLENEQVKFQPRFHIKDIPSLMDALEQTPDGLNVKEVLDSAPQGFQQEIDKAVALGLVIAMYNKATNSGMKMVLFPRGPSFLVPLSGTFSKQSDKMKLTSSAGVIEEINRGDLLLVGKAGAEAFEEGIVEDLERRCFRVSTDATCPLDMLERLQRLPKPYSRSSTEEPRPPRSSEFKRKFVETKVPLDHVAGNIDAAFSNETVYKHGCTNDLRDIWRAVCKKTSLRPGDPNLDQQLVSDNLVSEEWLLKSGISGVRRPLLSKPKRRGGRRPVKLTNAHLEAS